MSQSFDQSHGQWTHLLGQYLEDGLVDYPGLLREGSEDLDAYLDELRRVPRREFSEWQHDERLAYWINAYNAFTIRLVLDYYPVPSIRSVGLFPFSPFLKAAVSLPRLRYWERSLAYLEHGILRRRFKEPRIHFAIVCASRSCPVLQVKAFVAKRLDDQLQEAASQFLGDATKNWLDPATGTMHLSAIFKWFRRDFQRSAGSVEAYASAFLRMPRDKNASWTVRYLDYDWSLNEQPVWELPAGHAKLPSGPNNTQLL